MSLSSPEEEEGRGKRKGRKGRREERRKEGKGEGRGKEGRGGRGEGRRGGGEGRVRGGGEKGREEREPKEVITTKAQLSPQVCKAETSRGCSLIY